MTEDVNNPASYTNFETWYNAAGYKGTDITNLSWQEADKVWTAAQQWASADSNRQNNWWYKNAKKQFNATEGIRSQNLYQERMLEMQAAMNKYMQQQTVAQEPLKEATVQMTNAVDDTAKRQQLRSGLLSLTRFDQGSTKLGD